LSSYFVKLFSQVFLVEEFFTVTVTVTFAVAVAFAFAFMFAFALACMKLLG